MSIAQRYLDNCYVMKLRLVWSRRLLDRQMSLIDFENIILSMRKVVEGIAFCCLIATQIRVGQVPRQIKNNWNAEEIFQFLASKKLLHLPDFARLKLERETSDADAPNAWRLEISESKDEELERVISIYHQCHKFLHEFNPYIGMPLRLADFDEQMIVSCNHLKKDHMWIWNRFWQHSVRIRGKVFFINYGDEDPGIAPQAIRSDNFLTESEFDFQPLPWMKVFPQ